MNEASRERRLLVLTSTYPRWVDDPEPAFVHELAKRLTDCFEVTVLGPHAAGALENEQLDGVKVVRYRYAPVALETLVNNGGIIGNLKKAPWKLLLVPGFLLAQWWVARRLVRQLRPEVVHAHWLVPQGIVAALGRIGVKPNALVVTSHGADLFAIRGRFFAWLRNQVIRNAAAVTVVSEAMKIRLAEEVAGEDIARVMPMGIDLLNRFTPDHSVPRSPMQLLFVGRLVEKKGCMHLIDAMPAILRTFPDARLVIVGFGPELARLNRRVAELGIGAAVEFRGGVAQSMLPDVYRRAAVLVAPFVEAENGDQEGLGLVVAEAIGCHCPVVVGNVPAVNDLVERDDCHIVNASNVAELSNAVVGVLRDPIMAQQQVASARRNIVGRLSWDVVARGYAELLSTVADSAR